MKIEVWKKRSFEAAISRMKVKARTFGRPALISSGFGRGAQVGKTSLLEVNLYGTSVDVWRIILYLVCFSPPKSSILEEDEAFAFYNVKQR